MFYSVLKDRAYRILLFIFIADFFVDDGHQFPIKRILYSAFIYLALYEVVIFQLNSYTSRSLLPVPGYNTYITAFLVFIGINLVTDLRSPALNIVTLVNNPYALLTVVPVFIFSLGANSEHLEKMYHLFKVLCCVFFFTLVIKIPGSVPDYQGYIASHAIIPFFIISSIEKKNRFYTIPLIALAIVFSMMSDQRIVMLKIIIFFSLFVSLSIVRNSSFLKLLVLLAGCLVVFMMLTNLESILAIFKDVIGRKGFDANDTRSFLYEELFEDFKSPEFFLGRGFLGSYFSYYFLELQRNLDSSGDHYQRYSIEVGFLELLLKGGVVFYILYTLPLWYVALKSIFRHAHTKTSFYFGIYVFTELLLMFFGNTPYFGFQFSLLFFLAGYSYRMMCRDQAVPENYMLKPSPA